MESIRANAEHPFLYVKRMFGYGRVPGALLDTHDALTDWYKHMRSKAQIVAMLEATSAVDVEAAYEENGVGAHCRRPLAKVRVERVE